MRALALDEGIAVEPAGPRSAAMLRIGADQMRLSNSVRVNFRGVSTIRQVLKIRESSVRICFRAIS